MRAREIAQNSGAREAGCMHLLVAFTRVRCAASELMTKAGLHLINLGNTALSYSLRGNMPQRFQPGRGAMTMGMPRPTRPLGAPPLAPPASALAVMPRPSPVPARPSRPAISPRDLIDEVNEDLVDASEHVPVPPPPPSPTEPVANFAPPNHETKPTEAPQANSKPPLIPSTKPLDDAAPPKHELNPAEAPPINSEPIPPLPKREYVFFSYSHKDKKWLKKIETHLKPLIRNHGIELWSDTKINADAEWRKELELALSQTKVAILLVSAEFLASDFIQKHELPPLLNAATNNGLKILWLPISHCLFGDTEVSRYQAVIDPAKPLNQFRSARVDKELVKICEAVRAALTSNGQNTNSP